MYQAFTHQRRNHTHAVVPQPHSHNGADESVALAEIECATSKYQVRLAVSAIYSDGSVPSETVLQVAEARENTLSC